MTSTNCVKILNSPPPEYEKVNVPSMPARKAAEDVLLSVSVYVAVTVCPVKRLCRVLSFAGPDAELVRNVPVYLPCPSPSSVSEIVTRSNVPVLFNWTLTRPPA